VRNLGLDALTTASVAGDPFAADLLHELREAGRPKNEEPK
jgi:hypothetical protein